MTYVADKRLRQAVPYIKVAGGATTHVTYPASSRGPQRAHYPLLAHFSVSACAQPAANDAIAALSAVYLFSQAELAPASTNLPFVLCAGM